MSMWTRSKGLVDILLCETKGKRFCLAIWQILQWKDNEIKNWECVIHCEEFEFLHEMDVQGENAKISLFDITEFIKIELQNSFPDSRK